MTRNDRLAHDVGVISRLMACVLGFGLTMVHGPKVQGLWSATRGRMQPVLVTAGLVLLPLVLAACSAGKGGY